MQKNRIYLARHRHDQEEGARPELRQSVPPFRSASRTPAWRARAAGRSMEEAEEGRERRTRKDSPESTRPPPWSPRIVEFAFGKEALLPHLALPRSLQRSLLFCILHWRWDLVVRFADAPPFRPFSHRTHGIVLFLQERSVMCLVSHVPSG